MKKVSTILEEELSKSVVELIQLALQYKTLSKNAKTQTKRDYYDKKLAALKTQISELLQLQHNIQQIKQETQEN